MLSNRVCVCVCVCVCVFPPQVQSDQYIPVEDIHGEMGELEKQLDELAQRGVELESKLRDNPNGEGTHTHTLPDTHSLTHTP